MIMSSERGSMSLSQLCGSSPPSFSLFLVSLLSLFLLSAASPPSPPSIVLKGPRTNYQKGHFHLWTAGFNRYLFHAFKINPIILLSAWFVYFALEYSLSRMGGGTGCNSPWTSIILDFSTGWSSMQKRHFLSSKIKTIMMIKKTRVLFVRA